MTGWPKNMPWKRLGLPTNENGACNFVSIFQVRISERSCGGLQNDDNSVNGKWIKDYSFKAFVKYFPISLKYIYRLCCMNYDLQSYLDYYTKIVILPSCFYNLLFLHVPLMSHEHEIQDMVRTQKSYGAPELGEKKLYDQILA